MSEETNVPDSVTLEYGDIIEIVAPRNPDIHQHTYYIQYIDDSHIELINVSTVTPYELRISETGAITDESVEEINLLSRGNEKGYARQNGLLPKKWVDIRFGGEIPTVITGEITNLEEDMIELTTFPDLDILYIDFEYKGIPKNLPIENIQIRTKPASLKACLKSTLDPQSEPSEQSEAQATIEMLDSGESIIQIPEEAVPDETIRETLHSLYIDANDIIFGQEEEFVEQLVEVSEKRKQYSIETQVNDFMDELLSTVPNANRTSTVLENIQRMINRFKELRQEFSIMEENGQVRNPKRMGPDNKPLVNTIQQMNKRIKWLLPAVSTKRKLYTLEDDSFQAEFDAEILDTSDLFDESKIQANYVDNINQGERPKYIQMVQDMNPYRVPFENPRPERYPDVYLSEPIPVQADLESFIHNLENFESTVVKGSELAKRKYVVQRYNSSTMIPLVKTTKTGRKVYVRKPVTPADPIFIKSITTLPQSVMKYSKTEMPGTNIMERSSLASQTPYLFRILRSAVEIDTLIIDQLDKAIDYEKMETDTLVPYEIGDYMRRLNPALTDKDMEGRTIFQFLSGIQEYVLDDTLMGEENLFEKFLKTILPDIRSLIRLVRPYVKNKMSYLSMVKELEPFMVYSQDITYASYMEIRYFIKEQMRIYKQNIVKKQQKFTAIQNARYDVSPTLQGIEKLLSDMDELSNLFKDGYKMDALKQMKSMRISGTDLSPSEILSKVYHLDQGALLNHLISQKQLGLVIPDEFMDAIALPNIGDMGKIEKIKATDCARRFLAKRYHSLNELQKDNHEDIFHDKEFDESPYHLMKKYKADQATMLAEDFTDLLEESLIQIHDCPASLAREMANTLISGKKLVSEGEYSILELKPTSNAEFTDKEKRDTEIESNMRKKIQYYRRMKNVWVRDDNVDDSSFLDNNTIFCNIGENCFKNTKNSVCETLQTADQRVRETARRKMTEEAEYRYHTLLKEMETNMDSKIEHYMKNILKNRVITEIQSHRANHYAFELGSLQKSENIIQSPHVALRELILSQEDFVKKQFDICKFVYEYTREAMAELDEMPQWLYCRETNTKLFPVSLFELASTYVSGGNYQNKQDQLCSSHGQLSDDGDSIVDKYSGYVIRMLDFSSEEGFDDQGFRVTTNDILQKDLKTIIEESLRNKDKIFENETTQSVYNIHSILCENLGIPSDGEEWVMRVSVELIETGLKKEAAYEKFAEKMEKQKGKRPLPYKTYRNQTIILIVAAALLIAIQTAVPSFKPKKTAPGCVRSFSGYPIGEDLTGLQYIACVVNKTKGAISPWDSLKGMPANVIQQGIRKILDEMFVPRADVSELYVTKREFILLHPEESIPSEHNIDKWRSFLPPVVAYSVKNKLRNVSSEMAKDFEEQMQDGNPRQDETLHVYLSKIMQYGYGIVEEINDIVSNKDLLLKSASNIPFLQNACCDEKSGQTTLEYFTKENPSIEESARLISKMSSIVNRAIQLSKPGILYHPVNTAIVRPAMPAAHFDVNIYSAFIYYCRFDRNVPVPEEFRKLCSERPAGYKSSWSIEEKIKFLKENGKRFTLDHLHQLMAIVYTKNRVETPEYASSQAFREFLEYLDNGQTVIEKPLVTHLMNVVTAHNPNQYLMEDNEPTERLKNYLALSNHKMYETIYSFLDKYGNTSNRQLEKIDTFLNTITEWGMDRSQSDTRLHYEETMYRITQFVKQSTTTMSRIFPEMILNKSNIHQVPKHWGLSQFHVQDISRFILNYYDPLNPFKNDKTVETLLRQIQIPLIDILIFIQNLPIHTPIVKGDATFYSLFDKPTIYMLLKYAWLSVLYEYIMMTDNPDILSTEVAVNKNQRREKIRARTDVVETLTTVYEAENEEEAEYMNDMEVQINIGNVKDLKHRVAKLLLVFLEIDEENKKHTDLSYSQIEEKMNRSKQTEKKRITDFFQDMEADERQVKNLEKTFRMGRWNVGLQKGLVEYDKSTYDRERGELIERMNNGEDDVAIMERDVYELDQEAEKAAEEEHDGEGMDIGDFGDDYLDGNYYGDQDEFGEE